MKKFFLIIILLFNSNLFSQFQNLNTNQGNLSGGLGLTFIDGKAFYAFRFQPEISFAKFGVGLDLNLEIDPNGNLRKENFNETSDYLSIIRYIRYGQKKEPVFIKVGSIDYYTLGHGSIVFAYNNSPSFDNRKLGFAIDLEFDKFGFESIYSSFAEAGVVGLRGYTKPFQFTSLSNIPIIKNLEVGATFAGDYNKNAGITSGYYDFLNNKFVSLKDESSIQFLGFDLGLPLLNTNMIDITLYFDYVKIMNFGNGATSGLQFGLKGMGIVSAQLKIERRWNGNQFMPSYFNSLYEIERFRVNQSSGYFSSKARVLSETLDSDNGYFGELSVDVLGLFKIIGNFQKLDATPKSGILHLYSDISPEGASFVARAGYDKINISDGSDLFTLDNRSYLYAELGYKPFSYLIVSMVYSQTFTPVRDKDDKIVGFEPQKKIEPRVSFVYPFNIGKWFFSALINFYLTKIN